jgi:hypothetical protein
MKVTKAQPYMMLTQNNSINTNQGLLKQSALSPNQYNTFQQQNAKRSHLHNESIGAKQSSEQVNDLEEMHCVIVSKIQGLRQIAYNLEIKIAEQEQHITKVQTQDYLR